MQLDEESTMKNMKKVTTLALAFSVCATLQAQVVSSEKTVHTESTNNNGVVQSTTQHKTETHVAGAPGAVVATTAVTPSPAYWTRLESAYKYANVPAADIARLRAIDAKVIEARRLDPNANLNTYYVQQQKILQPAQITKVRTYLNEHPLPETVPAYEVTTYETVPTRAGVEVNTPIGSIGVGIPSGSKTVETKTVVPAQP
jgi:hypothetical protein